MPCSRRIVASLDDLSTELLIIGDIQLSFVVQEFVEFFSLEKVVNQSARAFLAKYFKGLGNFDFAIGAVSNFLFEFRRFGKDSGGKRGEAFGIKNQLVLVVFSISDLEACRTRERVGNTVLLAWLVN
jgi:hypothetical protein